MILRSGLILIAVCGVLTAEGFSTFYLGQFGENAPSFEERFDRHVERGLGGVQDLEIADQSIVEEIRTGFGPIYGRNVMSREIIDQLEKGLGDSALVVWTHISGYSIDLDRRMVITCDIVGKVEVHVTVVDLATGRSFVADRTTELRDFKGHYPFTPIRKVHITAPERLGMVKNLSQSAAGEVVEVVDAIVSHLEVNRQEHSSNGGGAPVTQANDEPPPAPVRVPSLRDIFEMPVVEPPDIPAQEEVPEEGPPEGGNQSGEEGSETPEQ